MRRLAVIGGAVLVAAVVALGASAALDRPSDSSTLVSVVEAPRERVWGVVVDFDAYPAWNPYMRVEGEAAAGSALDVRLDTAGSARDVSASITVYKPPRKLRWQSRMVVPGLRDVEYEVILTPLGPTRTRVVQRQRHEGLLTALDGTEDMRSGLARTAEALERRVESAP